MPVSIGTSATIVLNYQVGKVKCKLPIATLGIGTLSYLIGSHLVERKNEVRNQNETKTKFYLLKKNF